MLSQILVLLLAAIAARVAYGLSNKQNMWRHIIAYWLVLTAKNLVDWMGGIL